MRKISFILLIMSIILLTLSINTTVFAEEETQWTDFSKVSFELKPTVTNNSVSYKLYFNNVDFNSKHSYSVYVSNISENIKKSETYMEIQNGVYNYIDRFLERDGEIYITVIETIDGEKKDVLESKKLDRPNQNALGTRITGSFFTTKDSGDSTITFFNEPHDSTADERKIKVKIGKVEDTKILNNIKSNGQSALNELLLYAKNQSGIYTETISVGIYKEKFLSNITLTDKAYYFVYFEAQNDDETYYYPVEDIMLAQAQYVEGGNKIQLVNYDDSKFVWNLNSQKPSVENNVVNNTVNNAVNNTANNIVNNTDNTVANKIIPAAGVNVYIVLFMTGIILVSTIIYVRYIRFKDVK